MAVETGEEEVPEELTSEINPQNEHNGKLHFSGCVILKIFCVFLKTAEIVEQGMPKRVCNGRVLNNVIAAEHVQTFA